MPNTTTTTTSAPPRTMRASVLAAAQQVSVEQRPTPQPGPGEVLVRVEAVGVCGSDVHYYQHGRVGGFVVESPLVLGHEASGVVVALGEGADPALLDRAVSIEPGFPCRHCVHCRSGAYNLCEDIQFFATPPVDGAFAEYVVAPADFVYPLPEGVSLEAGALAEPLSVAYWACRKGGVAPGTRLLVTGAGPIGLLVVQVARALGCTDITVSDVALERLEVASELGASATVAAGSTDLPAADVLIDCSGAPTAVRAGITALDGGGRAVLVGMGADELELPVSLIQRRELIVTGTFRYANTWPAVMALLAGGVVDVDRLVTSHHGLDDAESALSLKPEAGHIKAVVHPQR